MNVNATIDGQDVVIVQMTKRKYTAIIAYIDAQGSAGNLKIKEIPLTELPLTMATGSEHFSLTNPTLGCSVDETDFSDSTDWVEVDANGIADFGANGWDHAVYVDGNARMDRNSGNFGGQFDAAIKIYIRSIPSGIGNSSYVRFEPFGSNASLSIRGNGSGQMEYYLVGDGNWSGGLTFGAGDINAGGIYALRFRRNASNNLIAYVWNPVSAQWEWDGNTAGSVNDQTKAANYGPRMWWQDNDVASDDYSDGSVQQFCQDAGTIEGVA